MAKPTTLTELNTGEALYPVTLASLVRTADGGTVEDGLAKAGRALFIELWKEAGKAIPYMDPVTDYNDEQDVFYIYGLPMPFPMAVRIYDLRWPVGMSLPGLQYKFSVITSVSALLPIVISHEMTEPVITSGFMEEIGLVLYAHHHTPIVSDAGVLRKIHGNIRLCGRESAINELFPGCHMLEEVNIEGLKSSVSLASCRRLSRNTMAYLVSCADELEIAEQPITVEVHPDVYAKLTGDTSNAAAAELTEDDLAQWMQVFTWATEMNITFSTT